MNIVFLTRHDPTNINSWSGTLYHIYHKLKENHTIEVIGTEILKQLVSFRKGNFPEDISIQNDQCFKNLGRLLSERINALEYDLVFWGDLIFIPSDINIPFFLLSDMTFEQTNIHYDKPDERDVETYYNLERFLLNTATRIIFCSEWIKQKAIDFYNVDMNKIDVVEFSTAPRLQRGADGLAFVTQNIKDEIRKMIKKEVNSTIVESN